MLMKLILISMCSCCGLKRENQTTRRKAQIELWQFVVGREESPLMELCLETTSQDREDLACAIIKYKMCRFIDNDRIICNYEV
jgi:hypothetical protein